MHGRTRLLYAQHMRLSRYVRHTAGATRIDQSTRRGLVAVRYAPPHRGHRAWACAWWSCPPTSRTAMGRRMSVMSQHRSVSAWSRSGACPATSDSAPRGHAQRQAWTSTDAGRLSGHCRVRRAARARILCSVEYAAAPPSVPCHRTRSRLLRHLHSEMAERWDDRRLCHADAADRTDGAALFGRRSLP